MEVIWLVGCVLFDEVGVIECGFFLCVFLLDFLEVWVDVECV